MFAAFFFLFWSSFDILQNNRLITDVTMTESSEEQIIPVAKYGITIQFEFVEMKSPLSYNKKNINLPQYEKIYLLQCCHCHLKLLLEELN